MHSRDAPTRLDVPHALATAEISGVRPAQRLRFDREPTPFPPIDPGGAGPSL